MPVIPLNKHYYDREYFAAPCDVLSVGMLPFRRVATLQKWPRLSE